MLSQHALNVLNEVVSQDEFITAEGHEFLIRSQVKRQFLNMFQLVNDIDALRTTIGSEHFKQVLRAVLFLRDSLFIDVYDQESYEEQAAAIISLMEDWFTQFGAKCSTLIVNSWWGIQKLVARVPPEVVEQIVTYDPMLPPGYDKATGQLKGCVPAYIVDRLYHLVERFNKHITGDQAFHPHDMDGFVDLISKGHKNGLTERNYEPTLMGDIQDTAYLTVVNFDLFCGSAINDFHALGGSHENDATVCEGYGWRPIMATIMNPFNVDFGFNQDNVELQVQYSVARIHWLARFNRFIEGTMFLPVVIPDDDTLSIATGTDSDDPWAGLPPDHPAQGEV